MHRFRIIAFVALLAGQIIAVASVAAQDGRSFYTARLEDPQAVYLSPEAFPVTGDGLADDADALQMAIDAVQERSRFGIVFVPEGQYRLGRTVYVWKGIRLIGYGAKRPTLVLGDATPGFSGPDNAYMIHFVSDRPREGRPIRDANPGTFYSALSNINFEIGEANPSAVAVRSHFAQHSYLAHADFQIGSGMAGVEKVGNEIDDCRFFGGAFGIVMTKPSPSWPFLMIDSYFEGQRTAAIQTEEGGLTLVRNTFRNVPTAVLVNPDRAEELFMTDSWLEGISGPAIVISDENNARPQFNLVNVVAVNVPVLASFRLSGKQVRGPSGIYRVEDFTHGNQIDDLGATPGVRTSHTLVPLDRVPEPAPSDIPALPSQDSWMNVADLGAIGDGETDDTAAIQAAIDAFPTLYLPSGRYRVSKTIRLRPETVLIGLSPITTQLLITDRTPAFDGPGPPVPLLEAPQGGANIVTGIGLDTGGINSRAVGAKWMAGAASMMNDVRFLGGHGTYRADGSNVPVYNETRTADGNPDRKWDTQYWSLWVTDGGGGTFKDIWTPNPYAMAGLYVSNTSTEGRIYAMSSEHHVRYEVQFDRVANWKVYALQLEEESAEGPYALPVEISRSSHLTFANLYLYRVIRTVNPFPYGVSVIDSRQLDFRGVHAYGPTKFSVDNVLYDRTLGVEVRSREIARLRVSGDALPVGAAVSSMVLAPVTKAVGGFEFIDGMTTDAMGNVYFIDGRVHRIYRWEPTLGKLTLVLDVPISPTALAFDEAGNLLIVGRSGWRRGHVYAFRPGASETDLRVLERRPGSPPDGVGILRPGHLWRDGHDFLDVAGGPVDGFYLSPDASVAIPDQEDLFRATSLRRTSSGRPFYMADEFGQKTVRFSVAVDGTLVDPELFAEEGELDVAVDSAGKVYVAAGDVFVYDASGLPIERILVPERPANLVFGGADRRTLFIAARSSLYQVQVR